MKVSVSLPEEDVEFLDSYAQARGIESRSADLHLPGSATSRPDRAAPGLQSTGRAGPVRGSRAGRRTSRPAASGAHHRTRPGTPYSPQPVGPLNRLRRPERARLASGVLPGLTGWS